MTHARQMVRTNPSGAAVEEAALVECIEACFDCAQVCAACADACLGEDDPGHLVRCIRLDLDCADVCDATGRIMSRQTEPDHSLLQAQLQACAAACKACGDEPSLPIGRKKVIIFQCQSDEGASITISPMRRIH